MDPKVRELLSRVKESAITYGRAAGKFASEAAEKARLNIQIFDLNTEIDIAYKEIGKLVYAVHAGEEVCNEAVQGQIDTIDSKKSIIVELRARLAALKTQADQQDCCDDDCCCDDECCEAEEACCEDSCCAEAAEEACCEDSCCCEKKE